VAVSLTGGSGRASVQSPARLTVTAEAMTAEIVWSSPYYTYMEVDGVTYQPTNQLGENASFTIPVALDQDLAVSAETTAMSQPHVIDYQLRLDSTTLVAAP
jgi:iron complex transport system substrate-binding protein